MIRKAEQEDYLIVAKLAKELWDRHLLVDLENEFNNEISVQLSKSKQLRKMDVTPPKLHL